MNRFSRSWRVLLLLAVASHVCLGQGGKENPDEMAQIAGTMADQCAGLKLMCRAAALNKKYQKTCDTFKQSLNSSSNRDLATGYDKMDQKAYPSASLYASRVCDYDPELASKKRELQDLIKKAQEPVVAKKEDPKPPTPVKDPDPGPSQLKLADAERSFAMGELDAAAAAAHQVTDKGLQPRAESIMQQVASYKSAMQEAQQKKDAGDNKGALQAYTRASEISPNGPGDARGHIANLEASLRVPDPPRGTSSIKGSGTNPLPPPPPPKDPRVEAARLITEARAQRAQHNLQQAVRLYEDALGLQKGNPEATAELKEVKGLINSDPKEQAKVLADAIRAFYGLNYAEAEDGLTTYLSSTTAKYRGAAYFYLGASRLYRDFLGDSGHKLKEVINSQEVQRSFKDARLACYTPVDKYLSPVVLSAWNASSGSGACTR